MPRKIEDMFADVQPENPYPEIEDEFFEMLEEDGVLPKDVQGSDGPKYAKWLKKREIAKAKENGGK